MEYAPTVRTPGRRRESPGSPARSGRDRRLRRGALAAPLPPSAEPADHRRLRGRDPRARSGSRSSPTTSPLAVAVVLLAAVRFEPAPTDVVFAVLITVGAITSRFRLRRVIPGAVLLVGAYLALNLVSAVDVGDPQRAVSFLAITFYVRVLRALAGRVRDLVGDRPPDHALLRRGGGRLGARLDASPCSCRSRDTTSSRGSGGPRACSRTRTSSGRSSCPAALIVLEEILTPRLFAGAASTKVLAVPRALALGVLFSYSRAAWLNLVVGLLVVLVIVSFRRGGGKQRGPRARRRARRASPRSRRSWRSPGRCRSSSSARRCRPTTPAASGRSPRASSGRCSTRSASARGSSSSAPTSRRTACTPARLAEEGVPGLVAILALMLATLGWALRERDPRARHLRDRLGRVARRLVRHPAQRRVRGHAALAPSLVRRGADLGRRLALRRARRPA